MRLPVVEADPTQLRVLLQNLIVNALKFSQSRARPRVLVRSRPAATVWRIEVVDSGPGIPAADRVRVFDPLVRLGGGASGTGLGLSTCRCMVDSYGGRIGIDEALEGGAIVWFELGV